MTLFGLFGRKSPIQSPKELADFIDEQASSLLHEGLEAPRWRAYPLGLAMTGELIDGVLRIHAGTQKQALADEYIDLVLGVFDRHPVPTEIGKEAWRDARSALALRLDEISTRPAKSAGDIPTQYVKRYLALIPAAAKPDAGATQEVLARNLLNAGQELEKRMDAAAMAAELKKGVEDDAS